MIDQWQLFVHLGDSERSRAPCTNNAHVKFTTRKKMLRHRKNKRRGTLDRGRGKQRENSERIAQKGDYIHKQQLKTKTVWLWLCYVDKKRFNKVTDSLVFGELWGVLGFSLKHHLNKKSIKNIITHILNIFSNSVSYCIFKISH